MANKYEPVSPNPDYVFATNYGAREKEDYLPYTEDDVRYLTASWLDIPVDDVWAIPFNPENATWWCHTAWATFVHKRHQDLVSFRTGYIKDMFEVMHELLGDDDEE